MYQKQIEQLVVLQAVDDEIIILDQELSEAPKELADLEEQLKGFQERQEQIDEKVRLLKEQRKKLDAEIEDDASRIKKSKNKLMMVANTKEYHAMMREMDSLEKLNRMREEERVAVAEELDRQGEEVQALAEEMTSVQEEYNAKSATLEAPGEQGQEAPGHPGQEAQEGGQGPCPRPSWAATSSSVRASRTRSSCPWRTACAAAATS